MVVKNYWYKFNHSWIDDPKIARLSDNLWRRYFECFALAKRLNSDGFLPDESDISFSLRIDANTLRNELQQLAALNLVEWRGYNPFENRWFILEFEKSQQPSNNALRQQAYRERKKEEKSEITR
jgi:hypothetical protein